MCATVPSIPVVFKLPLTDLSAAIVMVPVPVAEVVTGGVSSVPMSFTFTSVAEADPAAAANAAVAIRVGRCSFCQSVVMLVSVGLKLVLSYLRLGARGCCWRMTMSDPQPTGPHDTDSRRGAVIGLLVIVLLIVGGLLLVHVLRRMSQLQDCAMSGRTNCAPIESPGSDH